VEEAYRDFQFQKITIIKLISRVRDAQRAIITKIESLAARRGIKTEIIPPYDLITREEIDRLGEHTKVEIFSRCKTHLDDADIVIARWMALRSMIECSRDWIVRSTKELPRTISQFF
jgi:hypothetical protein